MLTPFEDVITPLTPYPATTDGEYRDYRFFTLARNHDYVDRIAKFKIEEDHPDWQPDPIEIRQKGTPPMLILKPDALETNKTLDLDNVTQFIFESNANWIITPAAGTAYTDVAIQTKYQTNYATNTAPYTNSANSNALDTLDYIIELTKNPGKTNEKAYPDQYTSSLDLKTTNHTGAQEASRTVTVTRDVVRMWTIPTFDPSGSTLPIGGADVTVTAHTNQGWTAGWNLGDGTGDHTDEKPATYLNNAADKQIVSVPSNSENFTSRNVTLWAYKTVGGVKGGDSLKTYVQPAAELNVASVSGNGTAIPAGGVNPPASTAVSATFGGTFTGTVTVTSYDQDDTNTGIGTNTGTVTTGAIPVSVPANYNWDARTIVYKFSATGKSPESIALTNPQPPYYYMEVDGKDYYKPGASYAFDVTGTFPAGTEVSFVDETPSATQIGSPITPPSGTSQQSMTIPSSTSRTVTIRVKTGTSTYRTLKQIDYPNTYSVDNHAICRIEIPSLEYIYNLSGHEYTITTSDLPPGWEMTGNDGIELPKARTYWINNVDIYGDPLYEYDENKLLWNGYHVVVITSGTIPTTIRANNTDATATTLPHSIMGVLPYNSSDYTISFSNNDEANRVTLTTTKSRTQPIHLYVLIKWGGGN
jgi:hypothetical protein